jgi:hypothetical protein
MAPSANGFPSGPPPGGHRSAVTTRKGGGFLATASTPPRTRTNPPLACEVASSRENESTHVASLIDSGREHGFTAETCALDKAYDIEPVYAECEQRDYRLVIPIMATPG